jgi:hypothetical protein
VERQLGPGAITEGEVFDYQGGRGRVLVRHSSFLPM